MAFFAIDLEKNLQCHAMPAEKAVPAPNLDPLHPHERQAAPEPVTDYMQPPQPSAEPTTFFTGIDHAKLLTAFAFLAVCVFFLISTRNELTSINQQLQDIQQESIELNGKKHNLTQEVHELSNYDRIMDIAKEHGLKINEANIRNVSK